MRLTDRELRGSAEFVKHYIGTGAKAHAVHHLNDIINELDIRHKYKKDVQDMFEPYQVLDLYL